MRAALWTGCWLVAVCLCELGCSFEDRAAYSDDAPPSSPAASPAGGPAAAGNAAQPGNSPPGNAQPGARQPGAAQAGSPQAGGQPKHPANRLARETSPYLLLHAHNPVQWYPWGPEAFEAARREKKPIFLSIGYSSCFWCHVMERQVFENEEIAAYMNAHFINVKVDREERPDIDDIYMTAVQVYFQAIGSRQGGGWPLSMFLTPEGQPFAGGTYFPPEDMPGRPGFPNVLRTVQQIWTQRPDDVAQAASVISKETARLMAPQASSEAIPLTIALVDAAVQACLAQYDAEYGGLDFHPQSPDRAKFPVPSRLMLLQAQAGRTKGNAEIAAVDKTLQAMAAGGIYDHLAGGFHRYSTDREWKVPHFEKMLYDNAQLGAVYADAFARTSRKPYARTAEQTFDFILREMTGPTGGFYSALDAETNGVEGAFYVWSREEVAKVLGADDAKLFEAAYGLDQPEFFEPGYVLHLPQPLDQLAAKLQRPEAEVEDRLGKQRAKLLTVRQQRPALLKDDKVLTGWNGLMIAALARGGRKLNRPEYVAAAEKCAVFLATQLRDDQSRLLRTWRGGEAKIPAYLDDYAYLIQGLLALYEATGDEKWLHASRRLMDEQVELFWDSQQHGFYFTSTRHEALLARIKEGYDSVLPSGNSVSVRNLVRLGILTSDSRYEALAKQTLQAFAPTLRDHPGNAPYMALALQEYLDAFGAGASPAPPAVTQGATPGPQPPTSPMPPAGGTPMPPPNAADAPLQALASQGVDPAGKHKAQATIYLAADRLAPGQKTPLVVVIDINDGWHLNANPPRPDFVIPTELTLTTTAGVQLANVRYPAGHEFRVTGIDEPLLVYEKQVKIYGELETAPETPPGSTADVTLTLRYQACNSETCSPPMRISLKAKVTVCGTGEQPKAVNGKLFEGK